MQVSNGKQTKSDEYWKRAQRVIPCGTQTLSKSPNQFVNGVYPKYIKSGQGSHVFDVDGNEYIDYPMALGTVTLGYAYPAVVEAVSKQIKEGSIFTLMHPLEVEVAERIIKLVPSAEMVRFAKNGSDATTAAVRIARAYTGREKISYCGYHGWQDWYAVSTFRNKGIPRCLKDLLSPFEYNKIETLEEIFWRYPKDIAGVIMEPMAMNEPRDKFLEKVKDLAHKNGALLIFDEIVSGFRISLGGAQEYYGVIPDMTCLGKGMSNGLPLSAVCGRKEIMKECEDVFFSMTYGGETCSLAAAKAVLDVMINNDVIGYFFKQGKRLQDGFNRLAQQIKVKVKSVGLPPITAFTFRDFEGNESLEMRSLFMQEAVKRGILFGVPVIISYSHTDEDIEKTLVVCEDSLKILKKAVDENDIKKYLEGETVQEVFRKRI